MGAAASCLGKYRLIAELGRGGMAEVFLAVVEGPGGFNKLVVIKCIRPQLADDPEFLTMFLDEARLAARLNHPNIVQTNEIGQEDGQYFMAMEYLEGQPLQRVRGRLERRQGGLPLAMHLRVLCEVLAALHYAHELTDYDGTPLGVVHRDASPHNTFITYTGQVKLVDFGIAKALGSNVETRAGMLKGKIPYMAPEQARGEGVDRRADIFSVGVMIWEAIACRRLWQDRPDVSVLNWLVDGAPEPLPSPRRYNPQAPALLDAICMRALSPERAARHGTARELQLELEHALSALPDASGARDAGALIAKHFAEERARIRRIIEGQLRDVTAPGGGRGWPVSLPQLAPATVSGTPSGAHTPAPRLPAGAASPPLGAPSWPAGPAAGSARDEVGPNGVRPVRERPAGRRPGPWVLLGAGAALLLGAAAGVAVLVGGGPAASRSGADPRELASSSGPSGRAGPTRSALPQGEAPSAVPVPLVRLSVSAQPASARIWIDGEPGPGNPCELHAARDDRQHEIRVEAPGYLPQQQRVTFVEDVRLTFELERRGGATRVGAPGARPQPGPVASSQPAASPHAEPDEDEWTRPAQPPPLRPFDEDNPYAK